MDFRCFAFHRSVVPDSIVAQAFGTANAAARRRVKHVEGVVKKILSIGMQSRSGPPNPARIARIASGDSEKEDGQRRTEEQKTGKRAKISND
jgi:hypothetical protein